MSGGTIDPASSRLSAQDASFVYAETAAAPLHVGMLGILEDVGQSAESVQRHLAGRLHRVPALRQKLAFVPYDLDHPRWVDDDGFDLAAHVREVVLLGRRDDAAARRLMAQFMSAPLPRSRPLWELQIFRMTRGRLGMVMKIHHCLLDGVSAAHLATVLFDATPNAAPSDPEPWRARPAPQPEAMVDDAVRGSLARGRALAARVAAWRPDADTARRVAAEARTTIASVIDLARGALVPRHRARLTAPVGAYRGFETASLALPEVKALKSRVGCKLNDVALALVAGGVGDLLRARGVPTRGATVKAIVPVSRRRSAPVGLGNQVSMMAVDLTVDNEPGARAQLEAIAREMDRVKDSGQAQGADFWVALAEHVPAQLVSLVSQLARIPRVVDLVVTNVPGPPFPLYLAGGKLLEVYPFVPLFGATSLGVAVVSYDGRLYFGVSGDRDHLPDLPIFGAGLGSTFDALGRAATHGDNDVPYDYRSELPSRDGAAAQDRQL